MFVEEAEELIANYPQKTAQLSERYKSYKPCYVNFLVLPMTPSGKIGTSREKKLLGP